jgi:hypothetical protein
VSSTEAEAEAERDAGSECLLAADMDSVLSVSPDSVEEAGPNKPAARNNSCAPGLESFSCPNSSRSVEGEFSKKTLGSKVPPSTYDSNFIFFERLSVIAPFVV